MGEKATTHLVLLSIRREVIELLDNVREDEEWSVLVNRVTSANHHRFRYDDLHKSRGDMQKNNMTMSYVQTLQ